MKEVLDEMMDEIYKFIEKTKKSFARLDEFYDKERVGYKKAIVSHTEEIVAHWASFFLYKKFVDNTTTFNHWSREIKNFVKNIFDNGASFSTNRRQLMTAATEAFAELGLVQDPNKFSDEEDIRIGKVVYKMISTKLTEEGFPPQVIQNTVPYATDFIKYYFELITGCISGDFNKKVEEYANSITPNFTYRHTKTNRR